MPQKARNYPSHGPRHQQRLRLHVGDHSALNEERALKRSIIKLTQDLVSIKSQGAIDNQLPIIKALVAWMQDRGLNPSIINRPRRKARNQNIGVVCEVGDGQPPYYLMTACLDTAPFGATETWMHKPTSAFIDKAGRLYGRGSADSKVAVAIFAHLLLLFSSKKFRGSIVFLADSDEHSGRFGAVKEVVSNEYAGRIVGAFVGYPGFEAIKNGARGFFRAKVKFEGQAQHTGSRSLSRDNAVQKAAAFCDRLLKYELPREDEGAFAFGPKCSVTSIRGGVAGYSMVPDRCTVRVDIRLTPKFQKEQAERFLRNILKSVTSEWGGRGATIYKEGSWPAYEIRRDSPMLAALQEGVAKATGKFLPIEVSGPSNVGNYLASCGIDAVCGFGVEYQNLHAPDECINTGSIIPVYLAYRAALERLLRVE